MTEVKLKNQQNFNISEGNVKENNINVANNVAQRNSQDLTKQWKKGKLESGWYYVNYYSIDGAVMQEYLPEHNGFGYDEKNLVQEVLTPVPSYGEWQELSKQRNQLIRDVKDLAYIQEENQKLKELLKECRDIIEWYKGDCGYKDVPTESVLTKIDEALK